MPEGGLKRRLDLKDRRFGKLTVLAPTEKRVDGGSVVWRCRCDCGQMAEVSARRLIRGKVRSCGCLSDPPPKDYVGKRFGKLTVLEYVGRFRTSATINYWRCRCDCGTEVVVREPELQKGDTRSCGCLQKQRAREAMRLENNTSVTVLESYRKGPHKNNRSGYVGVFQEKSGKWAAYISFRKKRYWLGRYEKKEDAVRARQRAEEMHDDFLADYYQRHDNTSSADAQNAQP